MEISKLGSRKLNPITPRQELNRLWKAQSDFLMDVLKLHIIKNCTLHRKLSVQTMLRLTCYKRRCAACPSSVAVARGNVVAFLAARLRASNVCPRSDCSLCNDIYTLFPLGML